MVTSHAQSRTSLHTPVFVVESRSFFASRTAAFSKSGRCSIIPLSCFWESPTAKKKTAILTPENRIIVPAPSADGDKPSAERTRSQGCISAPLFPKGFSACRSLGSFFQIFPRWFTRQGKPEKCCGFLVGHVLCFRHNAFKDCAPDDKAVAACSAFLFG